jgi:hypothetical protein
LGRRLGKGQVGREQPGRDQVETQPLGLDVTLPIDQHKLEEAEGAAMTKEVRLPGSLLHWPHRTHCGQVTTGSQGYLASSL